MIVESLRAYFASGASDWLPDEERGLWYQIGPGLQQLALACKPNEPVRLHTHDGKSLRVMLVCVNLSRALEFTVEGVDCSFVLVEDWVGHKWYSLYVHTPDRKLEPGDETSNQSFRDKIQPVIQRYVPKV